MSAPHPPVTRIIATVPNWSAWLSVLLLLGCGPGAQATVDAGLTNWIPIAPSSTKIDVLFMIDNSAAGLPFSAALTSKFDQFVTTLQAEVNQGVGIPSIDLQLGVVTSDYGAGATGAPGCEPSPGGQRGRLQAVGAFAPDSCKPPLGANFIHYAFAAPPTVGDNNLPVGQDLTQTFTCMASVGGGACGYQHPLESVYAALHDNLPENANFVRDGALLMVVFVTGTDDGSAPADTDLFDKTKDQEYGFEDSFRKTQWGIECGNPLTPPPYADSMGPLAGCVPATNPPGKEFDISRYTDLFSKPASIGGLKVNPLDVLLFAIDAPSEPVQIIISNPGTPGGMPYAPCDTINEGSNPPCVPVLEPSCQNQQQPIFYGFPAVRLNAVVSSVANHKIDSVCEPDFSGAVVDIANQIIGQLRSNCVSVKLESPMSPSCTVEETILDDEGHGIVVPIPECTGAMPEPVYPCWRIQAASACAGVSPDGVAILIDYGNQPPSGFAQYHCQTM